MTSPFSNIHTSATTNSSPFGQHVNIVHTPEIQQLIIAQQQQSDALNKLLAQTPSNKFLSGCFTGGAYQQLQQQLAAQNAEPWGQLPSKSKGKGKSQSKGKLWGFGLPQPDPNLPVIWTCELCTTQHNHDSCWVCRNSLCKANRPDPENRWGTAWKYPPWAVQPAPNPKGKGKTAATGKPTEQQHNTPAALTLQEYISP